MKVKPDPRIEQLREQFCEQFISCIANVHGHNYGLSQGKGAFRAKIRQSREYDNTFYYGILIDGNTTYKTVDMGLIFVSEGAFLWDKNGVHWEFDRIPLHASELAKYVAAIEHNFALDYKDRTKITAISEINKQIGHVVRSFLDRFNSNNAAPLNKGQVSLLKRIAADGNTHKLEEGEKEIARGLVNRGMVDWIGGDNFCHITPLGTDHLGRLSFGAQKS